MASVKFQAKLPSILFSINSIIFIILMLGSFSIFAQNGNSISGQVFGSQRQPLNDIDVELQDQFSRMIQRVRTSAGGRYLFRNLSAGRYRIFVLALATDYEEQSEEIEIVNFTTQSRTGEVRTSGYSNEQKDFYLKPRRQQNQKTINEAIFAQEVPDEAKKLYEKGIAYLDNKNEKDGFENLKAALEIFPKYYLALERLGTEYVRLGYYDAARILLSIAVNVNPRQYKSWYGLAYSYYSLHVTLEATEAIKKALEANSTSYSAHFLYGVLLKQNKNYDQAVSELKKAKELSKDTIPNIHWQLALLYGNNLKQYASAADELELFLKLQPNADEKENIKKLIDEFRKKSQIL